MTRRKSRHQPRSPVRRQIARMPRTLRWVPQARLRNRLSDRWFHSRGVLPRCGRRPQTRPLPPAVRLRPTGRATCSAVRHPHAASYRPGYIPRPPRTVRPPQPASLVVASPLLSAPVLQTPVSQTPVRPATLSRNNAVAKQRSREQRRREHDGPATPAAANAGASPGSVASAVLLLRMAGRGGNCRTPCSTVHRPRLAGVAARGWVNVRGSRSPPLDADQAGGRQASTSPHRGASGAAPSLTPYEPTAFLRSRPSVP
jgi:hypothetical protein